MRNWGIFAFVGFWLFMIIGNHIHNNSPEAKTESELVFLRASQRIVDEACDDIEPENYTEDCPMAKERAKELANNQLKLFNQ